MRLLETIDDLAEPCTKSRPAAFLDRVAFVFLIIMVLAAPHSIAATQSAWLIGMAAWTARLWVRPRLRVRVTAIGLALFAFLGWSVVSASFSYEPVVSFDKLRSVSVLLIFIFVLNVVKNVRAAHLLAFLLIGSCMISVACTPLQKLIGRGVEVHGLSEDGPLWGAGIREGDTLLRINGEKIKNTNEIEVLIKREKYLHVDVYRTDAPFSVDLDPAAIPAAGAIEQRLGFDSWKRSSNFRAAGFYGHYTTFAEVLQLIGSLAVGLLIAGLAAKAPKGLIGFLAVCVGGIALALLLTVTRGSQLAFIISSGVIVVLGASRKVVLIAAAAIIPLVLIGLFVLQQQRQVGFFDSRDGSIQYRQMMWRDGMRIWSEDPRHTIFGVGMDSIKTHWQEWGMYDNGYQPMGHFHSTPVQLLVERGLPAILLWLSILGIYGYIMLQALKRTAKSDWRTRGIILGCMGGCVVGFFASGLVHYNLGDTEVAMVLYILVGLSTRLAINRSEDILLSGSPLLRPGEGSINS